MQQTQCSVWWVIAHYGSELFLSSLTSLRNTGWHAIPTSFNVLVTVRAKPKNTFFKCNHNPKI